MHNNVIHFDEEQLRITLTLLEIHQVMMATLHGYMSDKCRVDTSYITNQIINIVI